MQTISNNQDTVAKTTGIARAAVVHFLLDHGLPRPIGIRRPRTGLGTALPVDLASTDLERWVEATGADYLGTETLNYAGQRYVRVSFKGSVPASVGDVAVVLRITQRVGPAPVLTVVDGGAA
jgi:hypothetical protein